MATLLVTCGIPPPPGDAAELTVPLTEFPGHPLDSFPSHYKDFDELIGNHERDADQFYAFMPEMPPVKDESNYKTVPVIALQVTLFPGRGICIRFTSYNSLGDAGSHVGFIKAWASICKHGGDDHDELSLPIFDRSFIKDPLGIDTIYWKLVQEAPLKSSSFPLPTNRVRATFILHQADIKKLKNLVLAKNPGLVHRVTSFVVTASYIWTCLVKPGEKVDDHVLEFFVFSIDIRAHINPPVPANYFGNCLGYGAAKIEHKQLVGDEGFVIAAEAIAEDINKRWNKDTWVTCSPKFDFYSADFGWGKARKLEVLSIDGEKYTMSMSKSTESDGELEVGLSLPRERMEGRAPLIASDEKLLPNPIDILTPPEMSLTLTSGKRWR
ncbi:hypothetical protein DH2020_007585 [Rehmannia glutinosa]|uniref:Uncharacterized protein n=1 Tax=Rehmannia glutinosa TaxID=99300 RepID=A0ABR0TZD4_REHGL